MLGKYIAWLSSSIISLSCIGFAKNSEPDDSKYSHLETLARGLFYIESMYVDPKEVERKKIVYDALNGILRELDPHTLLMPSQAFQQMTIDTRGRFGGIGIIVSVERDRIIIISAIEDGPAHRAGLKSGDEIIAIGERTIEEFKGSDPSDAMRGPPGSSVSLTVRRKGVAEDLEFDLTREIIKVKSVRGEMLDEEILYARITSFSDDTTRTLRGLLERYAKKTKGLILDLRDNPGGLLDQAVTVSDLFIESGIIVSTVGRDRENVEREFAQKRGTFGHFPIIVLINGGSASASEIVAGALQDHERALIVGTRSFGKGSVQTLVSLPDRSGLKITVARYYTPKDRSIQAKGIEPDIFTEKDSRSGTGQVKSEANLKGHIESQDLSDVSKHTGFRKNIKNWPGPRQSDNQLVTAYTYLKGWSFGK